MKGRERGALLLEVLLLAVIVSALVLMAMPSVSRCYRTVAVEHETEELLGELHYQQMLARTTSQELSGEGGTAASSRRPGITISRHGFRRVSGAEEVSRHDCLPGVVLMVKSAWPSGQPLGFAENGTVWPGSLSILIATEEDESAGNWLRIDSAGRIRMERNKNGK